MSNNKITMKDVATEANVSLATVSYVLNNSDKEKISHSTRLKVLGAAKNLNYVHIKSEKTIKKESKLIGIIINLSKENCSSKKYLYYDLAGELHKQIYKMGYDTVFSTTKEIEEDADIISKRSLDAAFIIDINSNHMMKITTKYYVPIIFIDSDLDDPLFYNVFPDYHEIIKLAKHLLKEENIYLIMEDILNQDIKCTILAHFKEEDVFINRPNLNLKKFLARKKGRKGLIIGDLLGLQSERYIDNNDIVVVSFTDGPNMLLPDTRRIIISNKAKAKAAVQILEHLLKMDYDIPSEHRILLKPELKKE
ncbi:MAG: transcriptional regulator, LacI family [Clostridiales bacterium]|jgi:DNA-binding LacI/PurR family transcriptional regulator|nr:transcriptional regulator, LacI family [Clostridiales bacterium]